MPVMPLENHLAKMIQEVLNEPLDVGFGNIEEFPVSSDPCYLKRNRDGKLQFCVVAAKHADCRIDGPWFIRTAYTYITGCEIPVELINVDVLNKGISEKVVRNVLGTPMIRLAVQEQLAALKSN